MVKPKNFSCCKEVLTDMVYETNFPCRACGLRLLHKIRDSSILHELSSKDFAITDLNYGQVGALYKCDKCDLVQCSEQDEVMKYYKELEDPIYEEGRAERRLQAKKLLRYIIDKKRVAISGSRLLDVGAGTGILLEEAEEVGLYAVGIEPSAWLAEIAKKRGLDVVVGVLPNPAIRDSFDIAALIDVIEHVPDPLSLLLSIEEVLSPEGKCIIVTPDASSFFARILGYRWWHYRIAHISYFNINIFCNACIIRQKFN